MASTQQKGRGQFIGGTTSSSPTLRPQITGLRIRWRKLSLSARSILCVRATNSVYEDRNDWASNSKDVLHTRSRSDAPCPSPSSSRSDGVAPQNSLGTSTIAPDVHAEKAYGNRIKEAAKKLTINPTEQTSRSEAAASLNSLLIKERGAHRRGDASPLCDHGSFLHFGFEGTTTDHHQVATTDTIGALIDAMFQIGDRSGAPSPGPSTTFTDDWGSEKTVKAEVEVAGWRWEGVAEREKGFSIGRSGQAKEDADARRAWEAMKRRVMYIEEHGALPDDLEEEDGDEDNAAFVVAGVASTSTSAPASASVSVPVSSSPRSPYSDTEVELGSRESRAQWRKCWAQEALTRWQAAGKEHGPQRQVRKEEENSASASPKTEGTGSEEEVTMTAVTPTGTATGTATTTAITAKEKGRRHAGCWIRGKDGVFVRLVSYCFDFPSRPSFSIHHHVVKTYPRWTSFSLIFAFHSMRTEREGDQVGGQASLNDCLWALATSDEPQFSRIRGDDHRCENVAITLGGKGSPIGFPC
jgi:hypothetical protein